MNEKPILFSDEMVRAILEGRKTQTRRVITPQIEWQYGEDVFQRRKSGTIDQFSISEFIAKCIYGQVGDRLWVREAWKCEEMEPYGEDGVRFRADDAFYMIQNTLEASRKWAEARRDGGKWRPSIFMPRWASRINLDIVNIRVERVQNISSLDARAEGVSGVWKNPPENEKYYRRVLLNPYVANYSVLWDEINGPRGFGWDVNPWVWVVEFKVAEVQNAN